MTIINANDRLQEEEDSTVMYYPARIVREEDGKYSVFFLGEGMDSCMTYGINFEDALRNAEEALALYLEYMKERGSIPNPEIYEDGGCVQFFTNPDNLPTGR